MGLLDFNHPTCNEFIDSWFLNEYEGREAGIGRTDEADLFIRNAMWGDGPYKFASSYSELEKPKSGKASAYCVRILRERDDIMRFLLAVNMRDFANKATNGSLFITQTSITKAVVFGGWQDRTLF